MGVQLIVGLGNPGQQYARTRHNLGFLVIDRLVQRWSAGSYRSKFNGDHLKATYGHAEVALLKPLGFMNCSGESVQPAAAFFKVAPARLLVVHDELDLPFGALRLKQGGGTAGHNGLRSIVQQLGTPEFLRLRVGIGRPTHGNVVSYVLSDFSGDEPITLPGVVDRAAEAIEWYLQDGLAAAMQRLHSSAS